MQWGTLLAEAAKLSSAAVAAANTAGGIGKSSPSPADAVASGAELLSSLQDMRDINKVVLMVMVVMFAYYQLLVYRTQAVNVAGGMFTDLLDADWTLRSPSEVPPTSMMLAGGAACRLLAAPEVGVCTTRPPTYIKLHVTQQRPSVQASQPLSPGVGITHCAHTACYYWARIKQPCTYTNGHARAGRDGQGRPAGFGGSPSGLSGARNVLRKAL